MIPKQLQVKQIFYITDTGKSDLQLEPNEFLAFENTAFVLILQVLFGETNPPAMHTWLFI